MTEITAQATESGAASSESAGFLHLPEFNVVVAGNGAIGSAILAQLLHQPGLGRAFLLARRPETVLEDSRVTPVYVDAREPASITNAAESIGQQVGRIHLLINTIGMLHSEGHSPEKRLRDIDPEQLQRSFAINATFLPLLCQAFGSLMRHQQPAVLASLSARVGSIEDNGLGGWYSYRAAKAAQNMLLRTLSCEWKISHRNVSVVALHPGTVESRLSAPFIGKNYRKRVLTPEQSATALLEVIAQLRPGRTGEFYDWQGKPVPW
ncbi:SDR family NAD(P)-dependent oxidoreductase [Seongchinamella unica]|uniref:SDR family NAD(P)-dependent oxidoreductase n=1 Tax=Seongchinamella unica TaxID=2547392 RepID=A0A4R5LWV4_9GAMM|nr:SDR family NAD(P)-dependent oxidoreductase [Seongchinamella unica]TDG15974.1 SDR family NAD(P)-dependent oxidoreductase [Seongchinamella unica]